MRRARKILIGGLLLMLLLIAGGAGFVMLVGKSDAGREWIARVTERLTGGNVNLSGLAGNWPTQLFIGHLELRDRGGVWLRADGIALTWQPWALVGRHVEVGSLRVDAMQIERLPLSSATPSGLPPRIPVVDVGDFTVAALRLEPALAGTATLLSAKGRITLHSIDDEVVVADLQRLNGAGSYHLDLRFDARQLDASLRVQEPAGGPLENILGLPGLGALAARLDLHGPRRAARFDAVIDAGELAVRANGQLDLAAEAIDLRYGVHSPALRPRADLAWQTADLGGRWRGQLRNPVADGHLAVAALQLPGHFEVQTLTADLHVTGGTWSTHAVAAGVRLPGSQPQLLQTDPITVDATVDLSSPIRPMQLAMTTRLADLHAAGQIAPPQRYALELRLPDVSPLAAMLGQRVHGSAFVKAGLVPAPQGLAVTVDGDAVIAVEIPSMASLLGERPTFNLSGLVARDAILIDRARLVGRAGSVAVSAAKFGFGSVGDSAAINGRWEAAITDIGALSPALAGRLNAAGSIAGSPTALDIDAEANAVLSVHGSPPGKINAKLLLRGMPSKPAGTLQAIGMLDGAPLQLDVDTARPVHGAWHLSVRKADWKSAHAEGAADIGTGNARSAGQLRVRVADLGDLSRLFGAALQGKVDAALALAQDQGVAQVKLSVAARDVVAGSFHGDVQISGSGPFQAVGLQLAAHMPAWRGAPADLKATAALDWDAQRLHLATAVLGYRGETARLLAPAQVSFRSGLALDALRVGAGRTEVTLLGQLAPIVDLRGQFHDLGPAMVNLFFPDLLASGAIGGEAELHGSLHAPEGRLQLDATGVRFGEDTASSLPALALHVTADLVGDTARLNGRLSAGAGSSLNVAGDLPIDAAGAADLSVDGTVDLALASPFLEARGQQLAGRLRIDMHLAGTRVAPTLAGTIGISQGQWRDFSRGISVGEVAAEISGSGGALVINSFRGKAASGTVGLAGRVGLLQPGIPIDLQLTAKNAEPIASSIVTANLDATVSIKGTARERIDIVGGIDLHRTVIGIPNSLPPNVAVLDVHRRGQALAPKEQRLVVGLDLSLRAPQEILVQGRGLDAELGGEVHLGGTSDAPEVSGGFDLQRGSFTISGNKLTFTAGRIGFEGAGLRKQIDPTLDFTASSVVNDVTVLLRVTGQADAPLFEFSSVPSLPQDDIMARLFFREQGAQLTALQAAQIGAALATLSGVGAASLNPLVKLQRTLGLDRLSVGAASGTAATSGNNATAGASVAAGRYLSKRVYLEAKQSTTGSSQVQVDVEITKHLKVQTRLGNGTAIAQGTTPENDPGSSVGLSYQFEY